MHCTLETASEGWSMVCCERGDKESALQYCSAVVEDYVPPWKQPPGFQWAILTDLSACSYLVLAGVRKCPTWLGQPVQRQCQLAARALLHSALSNPLQREIARSSKAGAMAKETAREGINRYQLAVYHCVSLLLGKNISPHISTCACIYVYTCTYI